MDNKSSESQSKKAFVPRPKPQMVGGAIQKNKPQTKAIPRPKPDLTKKAISKPPARPKPQPKPLVKPRPQPKPENLKNKTKQGENNLKPETSATAQVQTPLMNGNPNINDSYAYQAMLNNMQFMNAIGLVNGIYQNIQQNNQYQRTPYQGGSLDKQTLFDEFYEYMQNKTRSNNGGNDFSNFDNFKNDYKNSQNEDYQNLNQTAVREAKIQGLSLEQYLEKMCKEDEFIEFGLDRLEVGETPKTPNFSTLVALIKPVELKDIVSVENYTMEDYQNLIQGNYQKFLESLKIYDVETEAEEVPEDVSEYSTTNDEKEETVEEIPELTDNILNESKESVEEIEQSENSVEEIVNEKEGEIEPAKNENLTTEEKENEELEDKFIQSLVNETIQEDIESELENSENDYELTNDELFDELYSYKDSEKDDKQESCGDVDESLNEIIKSTEEEKEQLEYEENVENLNKKAQEIDSQFENQTLNEQSKKLVDKMKAQNSVDNYLAEDDNVDTTSREGVIAGSINDYSDKDLESYQSVVYNAIHYDEIQEQNKKKKEEDLKLAFENNDKLSNQIESLKNVVEVLRQDIDEQEKQREELKEKYEITNTRNKEKDKKLLETDKNLKELENENSFMKSVVESLMSEVSELRNKIEKQDDQIKKQQELSAQNVEQEYSYDIVAPSYNKELKEINDAQESIMKALKELNEEIEKEDSNSVELNVSGEVTDESLEKYEKESVPENVKLYELIEDDEDSNKNEEPKEIIEDYAQDNLQVVNPEIFTDEDVSNVDGIIVDEDSVEVSGHFVDKMKNATPDIQGVYNEIKNAIMCYKGVKARTSSACETFRYEKDIIAKFLLIGKTMKLYLALDPSDSHLPQNIYHQKDESKKKAYKETPFMLRLSSPLSVRKAIKVIDYMFDKDEISKNARYISEDFVSTLTRQTVSKD